jgi:hypothetical protein
MGKCAYREDAETGVMTGAFSRGLCVSVVKKLSSQACFSMSWFFDCCGEEG